MYLHWAVTALAVFTSFVEAKNSKNCIPRKKCVVPAGGSEGIDDAPAIIKAFKDCRRHGRVVFEPTTYHVNTIMKITDLYDVRVDWHGTLLWSSDIQYWLKNSMEVGFQNQSTAFILGGNKVHINGFGEGTLNGNGDYWYQFISKQPNQSNYPGRPHAITFNGLRNSVVRGMRFIRSQMWTMSIIHSKNVDFNDIFVNNTGNKVSSFNNDGADTIDSSFINFDNWTIYNGDDGISLKGNSTDINITNCKFYDGSGIALGSIGQFKNEFETMQRLKVDNVYFHNTIHAVYFKTWTDDQNGYPPNGGGGGLGFASDMTFSNIETSALRGAAVAISQCTRFSGAPGDGNCTNSKFQIKDITFNNLHGTSKSSRVASLQCSAVAPCTNIGLFNMDLTLTNGSKAEQYLCGHVADPQGFKCTGPACEHGSGAGEC